jgi:hypothetical protein
VAKYNKLLKKLLLKHKLPHRQSALEAAVASQSELTHQYYLTKAQQDETWAIDISTAQCQLLAEAKCRKLHMGGVLFSADTMLPRFQVAFWKLALSRRQGEKVSTCQWSRFKKKAEISQETRSMTIDDMKAALTLAYTTYKAARKHHEANRLSFIESFPKKHRERILRTEEARRKGRISKMISGKTQGQGVINVQRSDMVNGTEVLTECITPDEMNTTLLEVNSSKYQQCNHSPFLQEPLLSEFGYLGDSPNTDAVLDGTYVPPPGTDYYASLLLQHMQRPPGMPSTPQCDQFVSTQDHVASWKRAKEYTSSGISGLHFGMFKAQSKDPDLAAFDASRRSVIYCTGSYYPRWNIGIDVMLLKASGSTLAHKLRTILLLEADFNMNCKKLGREGMWSAEKHGCVAKEQGGGRRDHKPAETSLNLVLMNDDSRFKRKAMAICSNDAKGCFDRIVHSVAFICLRRFGIPRPPLLSMFQVIQNLTHHIRTAFGDSIQTYGPDSHAGIHPNQGILQGNGAAGTTWTAVSSAIIAAMKSQGYGYSSWTAISDAAIELVCSAFVDDTDLVHSGPSNSTPGAAIIDDLQTVLDTWDGLLRATGGALEKSKSYWYLIDYERRQGKWGYKSISSTPGELLLYNDDTQLKEPVPRLSAHTAKQSLGIMSRPDGKMFDEVKLLRLKARKWADGLRSHRIRRDDAWYCVNTSILRTIEYPLVALTLSRKQCAHIMAPILQELLASVRVQRNLARVLVYGPNRYECLGINDPWAIKLILHLQCILRHCSRGTVTSMWLHATMEDLTLELGSATPFWQLDYTTWHYLATPSWIKDTWGDLHSSDLTLKGPMALIKPQRTNDVFLMDSFVARGLPPEELVWLNEVRMYKQVTRLSDITSADGTLLLETFLSNTPPTHPTPFNWPRCHRPRPNQFSLWKSTIKACFIAPHAQHSRLTSPLGPWSTTADPHWDWWFSSSENRLYRRRSPDNFELWLPVQVVYSRPHFSPSTSFLPALPHDAIRATVSGSNYRCALLNTGGTTPSLPPPALLTLDDHVAALSDEERWALEYVDAPTGTAHIATAISSNHCFAVSDASLDSAQCGTAAFTFVGPTDANAIRAVHPVPGPIRDGNSYRCELSGMYGIILLARIICTLHQVTSGSVHVRCDNQSVLRVFDPWFIPDPSEDSFDLVNAIRHLLRQSPLQWTAEWVEGHQDDLGLPLDRFAALNCAMDALANKYREKLRRSTPNYIASPIPIAHEGWSIWCGPDKIHSPHRDILYDRIYAPLVRKYWTTSHHLQPIPRLTEAAYHCVDWNIVDKFMKSLPLGRRRWCTKFSSENCAVGITMKFWKKQDDDCCPCCGAPEDTTHVLRCSAQLTNNTWSQSIETFELFLTDAQVPTCLREAVVQRLTDWRSNVPFIDQTHWPPDLLRVLHSQDSIGWKNFLEGLPSLHWVPYIASHLSANGIPSCPKRWVARFIREANNIAWNQWMYRNKYLHEDGTPRYKRAVELLDHEIMQEYLRGSTDLPPVDQRHFSQSLLDLLSCSTTYKQSWYLNVLAARQCNDRRVAATGVDRQESIANARLTHWIRSGRLQ